MLDLIDYVMPDYRELRPIEKLTMSELCARLFAESAAREQFVKRKREEFLKTHPDGRLSAEWKQHKVQEWRKHNRRG